MAHPEPPLNEVERSFLVMLFFLAAALFVVFTMSGCISVDKSVHVTSFIDAGNLARVAVETRTENTSDTKADGNTASAEADLAIPFLP